MYCPLHVKLKKCFPSSTNRLLSLKNHFLKVLCFTLRTLAHLSYIYITLYKGWGLSQGLYFGAIILLIFSINFAKYFQLLQHHLLKDCIFLSNISWMYMDQFKYFFFTLSHLTIVYICMCVFMYMHITAHEWRSWDFTVFYHMGPRNWTHVNRYGNRHLYLMSRTTGPEFPFFIYVYLTLMQWNLALYSYANYLEEWKANSTNLFFLIQKLWQHLQDLYKLKPENF